MESVAFRLEGQAARALGQLLEQTTHEFPGEPVILRFGRLWEPETSYRVPPRPPLIHIVMAGGQAARLLVHASPGTHLVTESNGSG